MRRCARKCKDDFLPPRKTGPEKLPAMIESVVLPTQYHLAALPFPRKPRRRLSPCDLKSIFLHSRQVINTWNRPHPVLGMTLIETSGMSMLSGGTPFMTDSPEVS